MTHGLTPEGVIVKIEGIEPCDLETARQRTHQAVNPLFLGPSPRELGSSAFSDLGYQPFFIRGTAHLLKHRGRFFQICSRHQVLDTSDDLHGHPYVIVCETSEKMMTAPTVKSVPLNEKNPIEYYDLATIELEFSELSKHDGFEDRFFPLADAFQHPNADKDDKWAVVGFPQSHGQYEDQTNPPTFHRSLVELFGEPITEDRLTATEVCNLDIFPKTDGSQALDGEFDGLSGAPVFSWSASRLDLYYRGLVITGNGSRLRLVRELIVRNFLDAVIDHNDK